MSEIVLSGMYREIKQSEHSSLIQYLHIMFHHTAHSELAKDIVDHQFKGILQIVILFSREKYVPVKKAQKGVHTQLM